MFNYTTYSFQSENKSSPIDPQSQSGFFVSAPQKFFKNIFIFLV